MPFDSDADTVFNPAGDPLPLASGMFKKPKPEQSFGALFSKSDGHSERAATQHEVNLEGDVTRGPARQARVAHLPRPPYAEIEDDRPLFPKSTEQDVAQELLTPDTFEYWRTITPKEPLSSNSQTHHHNSIQEMRSTASATGKESNPQWEDLSLGIQWIILLRLCEKQSFSVAVFSQLKLHTTQVRNFVTSYVSTCDEWHGWERAAIQQSALHINKAERESSSLAEWIYENRPQQPIDQITDEEAQKGLQFLSARGVNHKIDFDEWVKQKDPKCFVHIEIEKPFLQDCTDLLTVRRAVATNLLSAFHLEQMGAMSNDAFLGTFQSTIPFEDDILCNPVEISSKAQAVLDTLSADLRDDSPMPTPVSQYDRQHIRNEAYKSLKHLIPEMKPQYISGSLVKTRWEYDNGCPMEQVADYDLTGYTAEMQYVPEGRVQKKASRAPTSLRAKASGHSAGQKSDLPVGQTERYENHSSLCFDKSKYHSPAAFAAVLAGKRNASQPRIGAARSRFMTSNDKGQLMVGMATDSSAAAVHVHLNPEYAGLPTEGIFRTQLEVPVQAMETEPAIIPDLSLSDDSEPHVVASALLERNQRTRRPSARARESLQYALDMAQSTEITLDKSRGKKAHCARSSRKQADQDESEGEECSEDDGESTCFKTWSTQETRAEAPAAAAELIGFCIRKGNDLIHLNNPKLPSWPGLVNTARGPEVGSKRQLVVEEPGHSGSETSTAHQGRPRKRQKGKSEKIFGLLKTQELNSCPPPVSAIHCAWSAEVAEFAVVAEQAYYALRADHINPAAQVPMHLQMSLGDIQATLLSKEAEYTRAEAMLQGVNGPTARRAELAGVADSATFAIHATKASFALTAPDDIPEPYCVQGTGVAFPVQQ
ncbi:hypothetical protein ACQKWADRAFT_315673 [Trichoderma austrokoningii]